MLKMLSLKQASKETGLSYYCLRNLCLNGEIAHIRSGNKYMINADRLEEYLNCEHNIDASKEGMLNGKRKE